MAVSAPRRYDDRQTEQEKKSAKVWYSYRCKNGRFKNCKGSTMLPARYVEPFFFDGMFGGSPENHFHTSVEQLHTKVEALNVKIEKCAQAIANLYDLAEEGDPEAKSRIVKRKREKSELEKELAVIKGTVVENARIPSMLDELAKLMNLEKKHPKKGTDSYVDYLKQLEDKLNDNELRRKISLLTPSMFEAVIFDCEAGTVQPLPKKEHNYARMLPSSPIYVKALSAIRTKKAA